MRRVVLRLLTSYSLKVNSVPYRSVFMHYTMWSFWECTLCIYVCASPFVVVAGRLIFKLNAVLVGTARFPFLCDGQERLFSCAAEHSEVWWWPSCRTDVLWSEGFSRLQGQTVRQTHPPLGSLTHTSTAGIEQGKVKSCKLYVLLLLLAGPFPGLWPKNLLNKLQGLLFSVGCPDMQRRWQLWMGQTLILPLHTKLNQTQTQRGNLKH